MVLVSKSVEEDRLVISHPIKNFFFVSALNKILGMTKKISVNCTYIKPFQAHLSTYIWSTSSLFKLLFFNNSCTSHELEQFGQIRHTLGERHPVGDTPKMIVIIETCPKTLTWRDQLLKHKDSTDRVINKRNVSVVTPYSSPFLTGPKYHLHCESCL